jgi:outer membrane receptor protein involved in Fe transport
MYARQSMFNSELFGEDIKKALPIINTNGSDSAMFDNCLELLVMAGRSLPHAIMMMVPEPWENHEGMSKEKRAFYEYHSCLMEPWDGPAAMGFTDGIFAGAMLDRNGLRPARYYVTTDDRLLLYNITIAANITPTLVVYAGTVNGLEESGVAPGNAINRNVALPAIRTRQIDAGLRLALTDQIKLVAGVFDITKPYFNLDANGRFDVLGDVSNRGVEASIAGPLTPTLSVVAGGVFALLDIVVRAVSDDRMLEAELLVGRIEEVHLVRISRDELVHVDRARLPDAMATRPRLDVVLRVPVGVVDDDRVGGRQVDAHAARARAQ